MLFEIPLLSEKKSPICAVHIFFSGACGISRKSLSFVGFLFAIRYMEHLGCFFLRKKTYIYGKIKTAWEQADKKL